MAILASFLGAAHSWSVFNGGAHTAASFTYSSFACHPNFVSLQGSTRRKMFVLHVATALGSHPIVRIHSGRTADHISAWKRPYLIDRRSLAPNLGSHGFQRFARRIRFAQRTRRKPLISRPPTGQPGALFVCAEETGSISALKGGRSPIGLTQPSAHQLKRSGLMGYAYALLI